MPSKRERMLSKLRSRAIHDGIGVKVVWLKELEWVDGASKVGEFVAYQRMGLSDCDIWRCVPTGESAKDWHIDGNLDVVEAERINELKNKLGDNLLAVERHAAVLIVYWQESNDLYPDVYRYLFSCS